MNDAVAHFLRIARDEVNRSANAINYEALRAAADQILAAENNGGRVHVSGVGKPEHLAHYAASLLASTGTPATFLHGTEATHGSIGQLRNNDVLIAISNSGETQELLATAKAARSGGVSLIAVTGKANSSLARLADCVLDAPVNSEGGPLGLAPRASILVEALILQALSVELQTRRAFTHADYHQRHPAGSLGKLSRSN